MLAAFETPERTGVVALKRWRRRSYRGDGAKRRKKLTFNVDVCARKRQDLKYRFHLVPLACAVEEGLSFGQDTTDKRTQKRGGAREKPKIRVCLMSCPLSPFYMMNKPIKYQRDVPKHQENKEGESLT